MSQDELGKPLPNLPQPQTQPSLSDRLTFFAYGDCSVMISGPYWSCSCLPTGNFILLAWWHWMLIFQLFQMLFILLGHIIWIFAAQQWYLSGIHPSSYLQLVVWNWFLNHQWNTWIAILSDDQCRHFIVCPATTVCSLERISKESREFKIETIGSCQSSFNG